VAQIKPIGFFMKIISHPTAFGYNFMQTDIQNHRMGSDKSFFVVACVGYQSNLKFDPVTTRRLISNIVLIKSEYSESNSQSNYQQILLTKYLEMHTAMNSDPEYTYTLFVYIVLQKSAKNLIQINI
jgi:hypothetical protein